MVLFKDRPEYSSDRSYLHWLNYCRSLNFCDTLFSQESHWLLISETKFSRIVVIALYNLKEYYYTRELNFREHTVSRNYAKIKFSRIKSDLQYLINYILFKMTKEWNSFTVDHLIFATPYFREIVIDSLSARQNFHKLWSLLYIILMNSIICENEILRSNRLS